MENKDKEYMRFLAACLAVATCGDAKLAVKLADELMQELSDEEDIAGGIVDIVPKRKRSRTT